MGLEKDRQAAFLSLGQRVKFQHRDITFPRDMLDDNGVQSVCVNRSLTIMNISYFPEGLWHNIYQNLLE